MLMEALEALRENNRQMGITCEQLQSQLKALGETLVEYAKQQASQSTLGAAQQCAVTADSLNHETREDV